jgi:hypothetical protein
MKKNKIKIVHNLNDSSIIDQLISKSSDRRSWMNKDILSIDSIKNGIKQKLVLVKPLFQSLPF